MEIAPPRSTGRGSTCSQTGTRMWDSFWGTGGTEPGSTGGPPPSPCLPLKPPFLGALYCSYEFAISSCEEGSCSNLLAAHSPEF